MNIIWSGSELIDIIIWFDIIRLASNLIITIKSFSFFLFDCF